MEHRESNQEHYERVFYPQYNDQRYCTALRSIDTVRALHQTVVSLRSALDDSRQEIEKLKKQIIINNEIQEARPCHHPELVNQAIDYKTLGDKVSKLEKIYYKSHPKSGDEKEVTFANDASALNDNDETVKKEETRTKKASTFSLVPDISISTHSLNDSSTHSATGGGLNNQMASRIDVKIKVSSNINMDNNDTTSTETSERSDSPAQQSESEAKEDSKKDDEKLEKPEKNLPKRENPKVEVEMYEDSNTNTFNVDAKNLKIKITSEDNVNIKKSAERISFQQSSSEYLNLDIDDMSEGDNSVFTEGATTPIEQRMQQVEDLGSDNEAAPDDEGGLPRDDERDENENEEIPDDVDDIELIFSSEDNKEVIQEDLVSLSEYEPWQEGGETGAPILTKFSTLTSEDRDREAYYEKKKALKAARNARAKEKSQSVDSQHGHDKSLESTDSLSFDNNSRMVDYSLEKESSVENSISRDASFDTFVKHSSGMGKKWTNVNVLIETDMSKVGIGDENILDMGRRNTCPNPPLYR